ncbi:MAG: hypothetical protein RJQ04_04620 [Longimicrobiales bacterium]
MALFLASCGGDATPAAVSVRDSLGVSILEHPRPASGMTAPWRMADDPDVAIGVADGADEYQFFGLSDALRRSDGSIIVIDRSNTLRAYDSMGTHLWTAGRRGDGPGEFSWPQRVVELPGDTVAVWDVGPGRLSLFTSTGQFVRVWTVPDLAATTLLVGRGRDGRLLVEQRRPERGVVDGRSAMVVYSELHLLDIGDGTTESAGHRLTAIEYQEVDEDGAYSPPMFSAIAVYAPAPGGFWYGPTTGHELRRVAKDTANTILRWSGPEEGIQPADVRALVEKWSSGPDVTPELRRSLAEYGRTHPRAERFPAYEELQTDAHGNLWVRDFVREHEDDGLRRWLIFTADARTVLGRLEHSARLRPLRLSSDGVLGVERDDLGVERVVFRRVVR